MQPCKCYVRDPAVPETQRVTTQETLIDDLNGDGVPDRIATHTDTRFVNSGADPSCQSYCRSQPLHPVVRRVEFADPATAGWMTAEKLGVFRRASDGVVFVKGRAIYFEGTNYVIARFEAEPVVLNRVRVSLILRDPTDGNELEVDINRIPIQPQ